jgi:hypothetical protein
MTDTLFFGLPLVYIELTDSYCSIYAGASIMAEINAPEPESPAPRRPWHRLHLSTWMVLILITSILVLLIVPAEFAENTHIFQHGWPWPYLARHFEYTEPSISQLDEYEYSNIPWLNIFCWNIFTGNDFILFPLMLAIDIIVAISILGIVAIYVEWRRRQRWRVWQFTLRELLLLTIILAVILSWWRTNHLRFQRENNFMDLAYGGAGKRPFTRLCEYRGPVFLKKIIGEDNLRDFFKVTVYIIDKTNNSQSINTNLSFASELPFLETIYVVDKLTHVDFDEMSKLRYLKSLDLQKVKLTDADIISISRIASLKYLELSNTSITKKDISTLQSLHNLEGLYLSNCQIGDESGRALAYLDNLQFLNLRGTSISDASVSYLGNLKNLKELDIQDTKISSRGFLRLRRFLLPKCKINYCQAQEMMEKEPAFIYDGF